MLERFVWREFGVSVLMAKVAEPTCTHSAGCKNNAEEPPKVAGPLHHKSIYITSSRDQYTHLAHALWRYYHSPLCDAEARQTIPEILKAVADRMTRNVTAENNYDFLRADGSRDPRGICRMLHVRTHEAARLPMLYAAAWDIGRNEEHYRLYRKYLPEAIQHSLELSTLPEAEIARWIPPYAVLQMQCSLDAICRRSRGSLLPSWRLLESPSTRLFPALEISVALDLFPGEVKDPENFTTRWPRVGMQC